MNVVFKNLLLLCKRSSSVDKIYVHNWEGGHPDHDTSHVLGIYLAKELNILDELYQFPLYSGRNLFWQFFRLFDLFPKNGKVISFKIPLPQRIKYLTLIFYFKSQIKTFVGLYPFYFLHMIFNGKQLIQEVSIENLIHRPHLGPLLYERKNIGNYCLIKNSYSNLIDEHQLNINFLLIKYPTIKYRISEIILAKKTLEKKNSNKKVKLLVTGILINTKP